MKSSLSAKEGIHASASAANIVIVDEDDETREEPMLKNMTMLPPDAIRWMNKRRPLNQVTSKPTHIPPHQASQLREMFDGLDIDGGGEIDMKEFKDAIAYVSAHSSVGMSDILGDPKNVKAIFRAMDADGNGTVDFNEFVLAMTADKNSSASSNDLSKLRSAFYDFAKVHRRQNMLEIIKDKSISDLDKYQEFDRLFRVEYFNNEETELSIEEQVAKSTREVMKEKKKLGKLYKEKRKQEILRSRAANYFCKSERNRLKQSRSGSKFSIPDINKTSKNYTKRKQFSRCMEEIPLDKGTFLPDISSGSTRRRYQEQTLRELKSSRSIDKKLIMEPAISINKEWDTKAKSYAETGEF